MLAYALAWVIGLGSLGLYLAAFFFPEIHRKNDFIWSGVGLFYALILWVYAERITGGILLGQTASVALLSWLGWETLKLRRQLTPSEQRTQLPDSEAARVKADLAKTNIQGTLAKQPERIAGLLTKAKDQIQAAIDTVTTSKGKSGSKSTQSSQTPQSTAATRVKKTIEKDRVEAASPPPPSTDKAVAKPDQVSAEAAPITEKIKPEVEVPPPPSSTDEAITDEWGQGEPAAEVTPVAKSLEPKAAQTKPDSKDIQAKAVSIKDNLQTRLAGLQERLTNLPVRDRWNKLVEQATGLFATIKDRAQGIVSTITQRKGKPDAKTPQQPIVAPSIPVDPAAQSPDFDDEEAKGGIEETTFTAAVMDEVNTESTPVAESLQPEMDSEEAARLLTRQAATAPEAPTEPGDQPESTLDKEGVVEESVLEAESVKKETTDAPMPPAGFANADETEKVVTSDLSSPGAKMEAPAPVEEMAPEVEMAPEAEPDWPPKDEPDWPPEPEPDWSIESEFPEATEGVPPKAPPPTSDLESPEDKEQK